LKRLFDISLSALGLFLLSPFVGIVAWAIKHDSPGPVFYRGRRAGRLGKEFLILKFRTMYERPESYEGAKHALPAPVPQAQVSEVEGITAEDDPRITPMGRWLRQARLTPLMLDI